MDQLIRKIKVASKQLEADLVIKGGQVVNVFTGEIIAADIAIVDGVIAGIGQYDGANVVDASGQWIIPGLIDGHVHIESSMLTPREFAKVVLPHGVTTVITDPHEMANVAGIQGVEYMLEASEGLPLDVFVMLPSCVPSTPFETNGAFMYAEDLVGLYEHPRVLGLAEVMDYPALVNTDLAMMNKITDAASRSKHIDGHAAGINGDDMNVYMVAGIRTDHECVTADEAVQRLRLGMYLMIREGTAAKDLRALLPAVTPQNARRCLFVTDDKLINDLIEEGSVDHHIRLAIQLGLDPVTAVQMATLNAAECYGLKDRGAIAPGYKADLIILDDLVSMSINRVYKNGVYAAAAHETNPELFTRTENNKPVELPDMNCSPLRKEQLALPLTANMCNVIEIVPHSLVTLHKQESVTVSNGHFISDPAHNQLKAAVIERHHATGNVGLGIVKGFGLARGAIAASVAHDSHNLIVVGTSDDEMLLAAQHVLSMNGGLAVVAGSEVLASLPLSIGGLLSQLSQEEVYSRFKHLYQALGEIGATNAFDPFLTLSFLALPVIPQLKLTDLGLFEFSSYQLINIEVEPGTTQT